MARTTFERDASPRAFPAGYRADVTRLSVFIASSLDGYIADRAGQLDWLQSSGLPGEDYGYDSFIATVDAVAMGRGTYDFVERFDPLPYSGRHVYVFTHRPPAPRDGVTFWQATPREALAHWELAGHERVYVDGGQLISSFLGDGLIDDMLFTKVPLLLGDGLPLFHSFGRLTHLRLDGVEAFPSGMVNMRYSRPER